jgi:hypothetical protein
MKTFTARLAVWTKGEMADEVNEGLDLFHNVALTEAMITDEQAQNFVDHHYQWLNDSLGQSEDEALNEETEWQRDWYMEVAKAYFTEPSPARGG